MAGRCIVGGCFRRRLRLDLEFATHTIGLIVFKGGGLAFTVGDLADAAKRIILARGVFIERVGGGGVTANSVFGVTMALLKETCHDHT